MNPPTWSRYLDLLVSPDDRGPLELVSHAEKCALLSRETGFLHPILDDMPILLACQDRSYELEFDAVAPFREADNEAVRRAASKTMEMLERRKGKRSFAWEDEVHWTEEYNRMSSGPTDDRRWNDRIWQRQPFVKAADISGIQSLVDIGCGEGQNFRSLLKEEIPEDCLYIGADISLAGLRLNRLRNAWPNGMFIVCSADRLPLKEASVDLICYFGVLHHTEQKAKNFPHHLRMLKPDGRIILHEAIERPRILGDRFRAHESAHEERFDVKDLEEEVRGCASQLSVSRWQMRHSIFWSACGRLFGRRALLNPLTYRVLNGIDHACIKVLGPLVPWFRGGEVLAVLRRTP